MEFEFDINKKNVSRFSSEKTDQEISRLSEEGYVYVVEEIVDASIKQLDFQNDGKENIRKKLLIFFMVFLGVQFVSLFTILLFKGFRSEFYITDEILLAFIGSVFVETLGAVIIMIKFAFDSAQENVALEILHGVIDKYQKHHQN